MKRTVKVPLLAPLHRRTHLGQFAANCTDQARAAATHRPQITHLGVLADVAARLRAVLAGGIVLLYEELGAVVLDVLVLSALGEEVPAAYDIHREYEREEAEGQNERGPHVGAGLAGDLQQVMI